MEIFNKYIFHEKIMFQMLLTFVNISYLNKTISFQLSSNKTLFHFFVLLIDNFNRFKTNKKFFLNLYKIIENCLFYNLYGIIK